ncbi:hypothetical protein [Streptomyces sp. NPDC054854]
MAGRAAHVCRDCAHERGVHVPSLGRCLGVGGGPPCGCRLFRRTGEPEPAQEERTEPDEPPCAECRSPFGVCRCESWWERQRSSPFAPCGG